MSYLVVMWAVECYCLVAVTGRALKHEFNNQSTASRARKEAEPCSLLIISDKTPALNCKVNMHGVRTVYVCAHQVPAVKHASQTYLNLSAIQDKGSVYITPIRSGMKMLVK